MANWDGLGTREMNWTGLKLLLEGIEPKRVQKRYQKPLNQCVVGHPEGGHMIYNFGMHLPANSATATPAKSAAFTPPELVNLVGKLEQENITLRRQVA